MMFSDSGFHGFFGGGIMWILWIVLLVVIIFVLKDLVGSRKIDSSNDDPLEILKRRYAKGEIDEEEYERRKRELEAD
ncbi:MAG: SHOCT domain-containing protein [Thioalkalispiraceae bacterium]|jgi:putative membrane protein